MAVPALPHGARERGSRGLSRAVLALACLAAFLAGRLSSRIGAAQPSLAEVSPPDALAAACLQESGLLQRRPPLATASGSSGYTLAPYQILSWHPRIVVLPNFIDAPRAQHIMQLATSRLQASTVRAKGGGAVQVERTEGRTSSGTFLSTDDDEGGVLAWLEQRIQDAALIPSSHAEKLYVIRYRPGERYDVHMDTHDPAEYGAQDSMRLATVVVYLQAPDAGGETIFPREGAGGAERPVGPASCSAAQGLKYRPRQGDALLFYSLDLAGGIDPHAAHGGCPVLEGEKWVITAWLRNKPVRAESRGGFGWGH